MNKLFKKLLSLFTISVFLFGITTPTLADTIVGPGSEKKVYPLTAGQHINVGNITVWNDNTTLHVQYNTTDGWFMKENQLDVLLSAPTNHPTPGQLTYKRESNELLQTYQVDIPLNDFSNATDIYIVAHTTVVKEGSSGETAWGGDIKGAGGAWYYYIHYHVQHTGTIIVKKNIGDKDGPAQQGVAFKLTNEANTIELNGITDSDGQITFNNLPEGNYKLYELVPEGYETDLNDETRTIQLDEGATVTKQVINTVKPSTIIVKKTIDSKNGTPQENVEFTLTKGDNKITKKTGSDGLIKFENLEAGTYTLSENVPDGYNTSLNNTNNQITVKPGETKTEYVVNALKPAKLIIHKNIESENGDPQSNVEFTLTNGSITLKGKTNDQGILEFNDLAPGNYTLSEIVPNGYTSSLGENNNSITLSPGQTLAFQVINTPNTPPTENKGTLIIQKNIKSKTGVPQAGVQFTLSNGTNQPLTGKTDTNGQLKFENIDPGIYTLAETVPAGYETDLKADSTVEIKAGEITYKQVINTQKPSSILVKKTIGSRAGKAQEGVEFILSNGQDEIKGKTNGNGEILFNNLTSGKYTLTEVVPNGYTTDLDYTNNIIDLNADEHKEIYVVNKEKPSTIIVQKNIASETGIPQGDVEFILTNGKDTYNGKTNGDGQIIFDNLKSGTYTLTENVPSDYNSSLNGTNNQITVNPGETIIKHVVNTLKTAVIIVQKNIDTIDGDPQADVTFTLTNGTVNLTAVTNESGQAEFENLIAGTYTLNEIVPDGYSTDLTNSNNIITVKPGETFTKHVINTADIPDDNPPEGSTDIPSIKIVKTADKTQARPGDTVKYTIAVTNDGNVDLTNVNVKDEMIGLNETIAELKVGKTVYYKKSYVIPEDTPVGDFKNTAIAKVQYEGEIIEKSDDVIIEIIEDPVEIEDEDPPYGPALPQTGGVSADMFYMVGSIIILAGAGMLKKRK